MKKLFIILFSFIVLFTYGVKKEKILLKEEDFNDKVFEIDLSSDIIYDKTINWIAENFKSSKSVIEVQDKQQGKIIGNGIGKIDTGLNTFDLLFTITVDIKDGKYKIKYSNLLIHWYIMGKPDLEFSIYDKFYSMEAYRQEVYKYL